MKCSWCQQREVEFELAIYHLKKEETHLTFKSAIGETPREQLLRNGLYLKVQLCEKCLPCTATKNPLRARLRGE